MNQLLLDLSLVPSLPHGVRVAYDDLRKQWMLLAPERLYFLNEISRYILQLVDGKTTIKSLIDELASKFAAPRSQIEADVCKLLEDLIRKRLVEV